MNTAPLTPEEKVEMLRKHAAQLFEHFEAVQILVSQAGLTGTERLFIGGGNWYARQGMAHAFIKREEAQDLASEITNALNPDE